MKISYKNLQRRELLAEIRKETASMLSVLEHWNNSSMGTLMLVKKQISNLSKYLPDLETEIMKGE